ncbi:hypothetical protein Cgig2_012276 [Carnegiea gigantea]|uniref:Uncharacterized protein n=1 Tax=Carnegiea gigantea TaxID=171969 RepID=A0A9Q1K2T6_9CARY|nr:hypothetical protein Cgig2_012276 [Carnegiea gigantea]
MNSETMASAAHMAGITYALNTVHSFCVLNQGVWIIDSGAKHAADLENQRVEGEDPTQRPTAPSPQQRRSIRTHNRPSYLQDYVCCSSSSKAEHFCFSTLTNMCIPDAGAVKVRDLDTEDLIVEPRTYLEASQHAGWQAAMDKETEALTANET